MKGFKIVFHLAPQEKVKDHQMTVLAKWWTQFYQSIGQASVCSKAKSQNYGCEGVLHLVGKQHWFCSQATVAVTKATLCRSLAVSIKPILAHVH
jgi:hypothetical protein